MVDPQVGEFVTSLDMAGLSLTLVWLDEVIEPLWLAPCDTPAFRRGSVAAAELDDTELPQEAEAVVVTAEGSPQSRRIAAGAVRALEAISAVLADRQAELGRLDSVAGDGDHGIGMARGSAAAASEAAAVAGQGAGASTTLTAAGASWSASAGGTSGALWGAVLTAFGAALGDEAPYGPERIVAAARACLDAVRRLGGAEPGTRPWSMPWRPSWRRWSPPTGPCPRPGRRPWPPPRRGPGPPRGSSPGWGAPGPLGEKSLGTPDPGAVSFVEVARAVGPFLA